ncbi:hypothetical protein ABW20_dc0103636 [Dactylellina cionopaga]|nr:hypothetical protein ABW20_dc0103636 [Dactylellina cionopaga]
MIKDARNLFVDPKIQLSAPKHMLTLLKTKQPLFVFFIPGGGFFPDTDDDDDDDPKEMDDIICNVLDSLQDDVETHCLAVLMVGDRHEWESPTNEVKCKWGIDTLPTLARFELVNIKGEEFYTCRKLIGGECGDEHKVALLRDGYAIEAVPSDWQRYRAKLYAKEDELTGGNGLKDGWEYEFAPVEEEEEEEDEEDERHSVKLLEDGNEDLESVEGEIRVIEGVPENDGILIQAGWKLLGNGDLESENTNKRETIGLFRERDMPISFGGLEPKRFGTLASDVNDDIEIIKVEGTRNLDKRPSWQIIMNEAELELESTAESLIDKDQQRLSILSSEFVDEDYALV